MESKQLTFIIRATYDVLPTPMNQGLFSIEKSGTLKTSKKNLEDHFRNIHLDPKWHEHLVIPSKIPPIVPPEHQCDGGPPTGKEVERAVRWERTASATGPNGVPYKVYNNSTDVLRFLWRMMKTERKKKNIPRVWQRAAGVLISKEKEAENIRGQDLLLCDHSEDF